jgi:hypothetical protein
VRLDGDAIGRAQDVEVERRHQGDQRRRGGLMATDLHAIAVRPDEVRVMDHPGAEPQHLLFESAQRCKTERLCRAGVPQADRRFGHDLLRHFLDEIFERRLNGSSLTQIGSHVDRSRAALLAVLLSLPPIYFKNLRSHNM